MSHLTAIQVTGLLLVGTLFGVALDRWWLIWSDSRRRLNIEEAMRRSAMKRRRRNRR